MQHKFRQKARIGLGPLTLKCEPQMYCIPVGGPT